MVKTISPKTAIVCGLSLTGAALCGAPSAQARVTQVVITATETPTFGGKSFGAPGNTSASADRSSARSIPGIRSMPSLSISTWRRKIPTVR
jgi:hypothetical protein